jgi:2-methylisocitrate lyase-like PEP mutase family enzyme
VQRAILIRRHRRIAQHAPNAAIEEIPAMNTRETFRRLHETQFILPNPWDIGSARLFASLGFSALATTSAGHAASLGRPDGEVTRDEAIAHGHLLAGATPLPVSADLENGFGDDPKDVALTIEQASATALAGCSIEDYGPEEGLYDIGLATDRIAAAVETNQKNASPLVLTARAENHIRGNPNLADTIERLQAYQAAGAEVLYAPGLVDLDEIRSVLSSIDLPLNALIMPGGPSSRELFAAGVRRISVGSAISLAAQAAAVEAARELLDHGTHEFWARALPHIGAITQAQSKDA